MSTNGSYCRCLCRATFLVTETVLAGSCCSLTKQDLNNDVLAQLTTVINFFRILLFGRAANFTRAVLDLCRLSFCPLKAGRVTIFHSALLVTLSLSQVDDFF